MDAVIELLYRAVGPIILVAGLSIAIVMGSSIDRANSAVQSSMQSTYALSSVDPGKTEVLTYSIDDIRDIIYNNTDVGTIIEIHDYNSRNHVRFKKTGTSYAIECATAGIGDDIIYTPVFDKNTSLSNYQNIDAEITLALQKVSSIPNKLFTAKFNYSETNGKTNIIFE